MLAHDGTLGPVTTTLVVVYVAVAVSSIITPGRPVAWWAARAGSALLGLDFLAAVGDRFGLFGEPGTGGASWGSWGRFVDYTESLTPWWPWPQVPAVTATVAEVTLGGLLLAGIWWRWVGKAAAGLLFVYLVTMALELGWAEVLTFGVPVLLGGALLGSARGAARRWPWWSAARPD
ncbi:hypothetical protein [Promicromonospora sp. NPDC023987]|uniref:hypothetical protein n=1 Tax=Promicromonospora sp. NPDC023987 TaxID=3155360 RepID=UPI00340A890C